MKTGLRFPAGLVAALMICMVLTGFETECRAERFALEAPIRIQSQYLSTADLGISSNVDWTVRPGLSENKVVWQFFMDGKKLFCTLSTEYSQLGDSFVLIDGRGQVLERSQGSFVPVVGFPAPCRVFDLDTLEGEGRIEIIRNAGGRRFSTILEYTCEPVDYDSAIENGWLLKNGASYDPDAELVMVTVAKKLSSWPLFKQLWQKGADWWLYEETEIGKSWRK